eukprot:m.83574 g.83574  ORF g.83574 m.83574 type:complete len:950 (+) comp21130_c0_seq3:474-3323(+)
MAFHKLLCLAFFATTLAQSGWVKNDEGTFEYWHSKNNPEEPDILEFDEAEAKCVSMGGHLASAHTKEENLFIYNLNPGFKQSRWLGGKRKRDGTPRPFAWTWTDGTSFDIFSEYPSSCLNTWTEECLWAEGPVDDPQPNDASGEDDCIQMGGKDTCTHPGCWHDEFCKLKRQYTCKREVLACKGKIPNLHKYAESSCGLVLAGDSCTATCQEGFISSGNPDYLCDETGKFSGGSLVCTGKDCGPLQVANAVSSCGDTTAPNQCQAQCVDGYEKASGTSNTFTCSTSGEWTGNLQCQKKDCGATLPVSNGQSNCASTTFESTCKASCIPGYQQISSTSFTCAASGNWEGGSLSCQIKDCGPLDPGNDLASVNCASTTFGSTCTVSCQFGYELKSGINPEYECLASGKWSKKNVVCEVATCDPVLSFTNGQGDCPNNEFQDTCTASCDEGYNQISASAATCSGNGVWIGGSLQCEIKDCGPVSFSDDSLISSQCTTTTFGATCAPACAVGYDLNKPSASIECLSTGQWSSLPANTQCLPKNCGSTPAANSVLAPSCSSTVFGSTCQVNCAEGFQGDSVSYSCSSAGVWAPKTTPIACQKIDCGATIPDLPEGATGTCSGDTTFGATCDASCGNGRLLGGELTYTCGASGVWEGGCFACTDWAINPEETFQYYNSNSFGERTMPFDEAQARCQELGGNLASVTSKAENLFIYSLDPDLSIKRWLGAQRDRANGLTVAPYSWTWIDGEDFTIFDDYEGCTPGTDCLWAFGDPNDVKLKEDCAQMGHNDPTQNDGTWNDANCNHFKHFVCKKPLVLPQLSCFTTTSAPEVTTTAVPSTTSTTTTTQGVEVCNNYDETAVSPSSRFKNSFKKKFHIAIDESNLSADELISVRTKNSISEEDFIHNCKCACNRENECQGVWFQKKRRRYLCTLLSKLGRIITVPNTKKKGISFTKL